MKLLLCALLLSALPALLRAEVREFKNNKGQILKAEPVVVRGMNVILRMENKQQVPVPLKNFSAEDQTWLLQWMVWDPKALDYNFGCTEVEKTGDGLRQKFPYYRYEVTPRGYEVKICNRSQSTLEGVKVAYRIFLEDRVDDTGNVKLKVSYHTGMSVLPRMQYNATHNLITRKLNCEKLTPVDGYTFYVDKVTRDRLRGVWMRFYRHGVMVSEWKSPGVPKCDWPENSKESKEMAADQEAAKKGAEAAAKAAALHLKPELPQPIAPPVPAPVPDKDDKDELPQELKIFELD
jgi:hypothetical protein